MNTSKIYHLSSTCHSLTLTDIAEGKVSPLKNSYVLLKLIVIVITFKLFCLFVNK